eukprot:jgi/Tetstr1/448369/TSEL_035651.t1
MASGSAQPGRAAPVSNVKVVELRPTSKPVLLVKFVVLEKHPIQVIKSQDDEGKAVDVPICTALVADETASVVLQLWGDAEIDYVNVRDIVRLSQGMFTYYKNTLMLRAGRRGYLEKLGEFSMVFSDAINMSALNWPKDKHGFSHEPTDKLPTTHWWPPAQ